jgi:hypothetical protein
MMNIRNLVLCLCLAPGLAGAASTAPTPKFDEVFKVLSTNLGGVSAADLDRAAVEGLIAQLGPRVTLVDGSSHNQFGSTAAPVASWRVFDGAFAYLRVADVSGNLPAAFRSTFRQMTETNKIKGLVLDLRFAGGTDYEAAAKVADCFLNGEHPLLDWHSGSAHSTKKADAIQVPVTILVNCKTTGAAEALAAVLREENVGLILGSATAGQASLYKEFPLSNGEELRVAVASVSLSGGKVLAQGVVPDVAINASLEDQRAQLQDPYLELHSDVASATATTNKPAAVAKTATATNGTPRPARRFNEAELVREHQAGEDGEGNEIAGAPAPVVPVIADTVLSRALDLLKGLSIVQPNRPG